MRFLAVRSWHESGDTDAKSFDDVQDAVAWCIAQEEAIVGPIPPCSCPPIDKGLIAWQMFSPSRKLPHVVVIRLAKS